MRTEHIFVKILGKIFENENILGKNFSEIFRYIFREFWGIAGLQLTFLALAVAEMEGHQEEGRVTSARQVPSPRWPLGLHSDERVDLLQYSKGDLVSELELFMDTE